MPESSIVCASRSDATPEPELEAVKDARATAWRYALDCLQKNRMKKGGPATAPDDAIKESSEGGGFEK